MLSDTDLILEVKVTFLIKSLLLGVFRFTVQIKIKYR